MPPTEIVWPVPEPAKVIFAGDWHADRSVSDAVLRQAGATGVDLIVQLGDFGLRRGITGDDFLDAVDARCAQTGVPVAWIDGNQENFDLLEETPVDPLTGLRVFREHVWQIPRASWWVWAGLRFVALGGATSLDRHYRLPSRTWWPAEAITAGQAATAVAAGPADVLLTHDCPAGVPVPGFTPEVFLRLWPQSEVRAARANADLVAEVARALRPAVVLHSHLRIGHTTTVSAFGCQTRVVGLSDNLGLPEANRTCVELDRLAEQIAVLRAVSAGPAAKEVDQ
ncbi:MAG: metallophosphoesterase [Actinomycetes bacterium]